MGYRQALLLAAVPTVFERCSFYEEEILDWVAKSISLLINLGAASLKVTSRKEKKESTKPHSNSSQTGAQPAEIHPAVLRDLLLTQRTATAALICSPPSWPTDQTQACCQQSFAKVPLEVSMSNLGLGVAKGLQPLKSQAKSKEKCRCVTARCDC